MLVVLFCKIQNGKSFSALPASLYNQRLAVCCIFPFGSTLFDFPFQHGDFPPCPVILSIIHETINFFKGVITETINFFKRLFLLLLNFSTNYGGAFYGM